MSGEIKKPKRGRVGPYFIRTDLKWKELVTWHDVPAKKRDHFDYLNEEERHEARFVSRYGDWLEVSNFERMAAGATSRMPAGTGWRPCPRSPSTS